MSRRSRGFDSPVAGDISDRQTAGPTDWRPARISICSITSSRKTGALVYVPRTQVETPLGKPPSTEFVERLRSLGVDGIEVGRVIVSTWLPNHIAVLQAIQELGLELHVIFNKSSRHGSTCSA